MKHVEIKTAEKIFKTISLSIFGLALFFGAMMYLGNFENYINRQIPNKTQENNTEDNIQNSELNKERNIMSDDVANFPQILIILSQLAIVAGTISTNVGRVFERSDI